ncbi:unnamed protein product [Amaranthus hypochondriacus]
MNAEEKRASKEEIIETMNRGFAEFGAPNQERNNRNYEDRSLRVDVAEFTRQSLNPEDYIDWESSLESYFEYRETPDDKQYKMAKVKLTKLAAIWLEGIQRQRTREGKEKIKSWAKLKKKLRRKYVPSNYTQQLSMKWNTLTQGNKTVAQYIQEWEKLYVLCDVNDSEDMRVGKFLGGLREDLRMKLSLIPNLTVALAGEHALLLEQYAKKRTSHIMTLFENRPSQPMNTRSGNTTAPIRPNPSIETKGKGVTPIKDVVCFKCHGHGHFKVNCPNNRAFTLTEWEDIRNKERPRTILVSINGREEERGTATEEEDSDGTYIIKETGEVTTYEFDSDFERKTLNPEEEGYRALVIRISFHTTPKGKKSDQRENIFQTKCWVNKKLCDLIIDGGSETNCVSQDLVQELKLKTQTHPHPYKLKWLDNNASGSVGKQCLVSLTIGSYQDQILCDVLDMSAYHILLGRPWQYDRRVKHDGYNNVYTLRHEGRLKDPIPLPPHKSILPPKNKQHVHLINRKICTKEIEQ